LSPFPSAWRAIFGESRGISFSLLKKAASSKDEAAFAFVAFVAFV
jgi:hypothetical protein